MSKPDIVTQKINPPIAVRGLDWCAHLESYEPWDLIGYGATESEAVSDLMVQIASDRADRLEYLEER